MWKKFRINIFETVFMYKTFGTFLNAMKEEIKRWTNKQTTIHCWNEYAASCQYNIRIFSGDIWFSNLFEKKRRSLILATVLNPRYITRISWRVNFVNRHRSSKATGIGFGVRADGSNSNRTTSSSIGLSGGVAMLHTLFHSRYYTLLVQFVRHNATYYRWFFSLSMLCPSVSSRCMSVSV